MTFFQCVQRYERKDSEKGPIPFSAFLYSYFFYLLKKNVDTFLIDQLGRKSFAILDNSSSENSDHENEGPGINVDTIEHAIKDLMFAEPIDEFWVLGQTAMTPFDELTVQERQLLKWKYIDKHRSSEIALKITEHPNTVREHMTKIKTKLKEIIQKNNMHEFVIPISFGE